MRGFLKVAVLLSLLIAPAAAWGHPSVDGGLDVIVYRDRVTLKARISLIEVDVVNPIDASGPLQPANLLTAIQGHGAYVTSHLHVSADGSPLEGKILSASPPRKPISWETFEENFAVYEIEYAVRSPPQVVEIRQDSLKEYSRLGQPWVVQFAAKVQRDGDERVTQTLLVSNEPLTYTCDWGCNSSSGSGWLRTARLYTRSGLEHILTGYDHLLFVAALVIAASRLWDLVKVVSAFAIAHTLTLTLSVLHLVRLPPSVVEPVIAASIVFVAMQNVLFPRQSRGRARLAVAFAFGLFHGLGFAGGLMRAMEEMPSSSLVIALVSFTLGVELAHQILIVPLYFLLRPMRAISGIDGSRVMPVPLRFASILICAAGMFYLIGSLRFIGSRISTF